MNGSNFCILIKRVQKYSTRVIKIMFWGKLA